MAKKFYIEASYMVTEGQEVKADTVTEAEDKFLEMLTLGLTERNIVGDESEEAEVTRSEEVTG